MDRKLKTWEIALMCGVLIAVVGGSWLGREQKELADGARKILEDKLKPRIEEFESADGGLGIYPLEVHKALADAGYYASYIPEEWAVWGWIR